MRGLGDALFGQLVQTPGILRNQPDQQIFQHPGKPVVGHDPDTETHIAFGMNDLQPTPRDPVGQMLEFIVAEDV